MIRHEFVDNFRQINDRVPITIHGHIPVCFHHTAHSIDIFVIHSSGQAIITKFVTEIDTRFEFCKSVKSWFKPVCDLDTHEEKEDGVETNIAEFKNPVEINKKRRKLHNFRPTKFETCMKSFDPLTLEDLAINKKKIAEVEDWIVQVSGSSCNEMLLLSGPVGCGKTATINLLAKKYNIRIAEWITPLDIDLPSENGEYEYRERQSIQFQNFIIHAANFSSLLDNYTSTKLVLIEDFPHIFLRTPSEFVNVLQFNAISQTGLRTALNRVSDIISKKFKTNYNKPTTEQIECVVNSSAGDVRSAILNLHFACLKGANVNLETSMLIHKEKKGKENKKRKDPASKFASLGKDQTVNILHGVGRVLNPKVITINGKNRLTHQPEEVVEQFLSQPKSFINFLAENYLPHFATIEQVEHATAALSDADCLLAEWRVTKNCYDFVLSVNTSVRPYVTIITFTDFDECE
ncbi:Cell cycle checkpoint protein RAD17 [Eumeta japonica]|uniref:Cell cycle checkpoint protein RAD17 n=1 Tax=Eumeta variegata TaxID=151549 RepID=A0A4C1VNF3_EUMVA|nr:Cell cycle checkpoint protein RAD17 [Eumeta japonica]